MNKLKEKLQNLYYFWIILISLITAYIFPYVMDYYVLRNENDFSYFFSFHIVGNMNFLHISTIIILLLTLLFFAFTLRADISLASTLALMSILSYASHIKYLARNEMFSYRDLFITEAAGLATDYLQWDFSSYFILLIGWFIIPVLLLAIITKLCKAKRAALSQKVKWAIRGITFVISSIGLLFVTPYMIRNAVSLSDQTQGTLAERAYENVLYNFLRSDSYQLSEEDTNKAIDKLIQDAEKGYIQKGSSDVQPNVIVIMNESWWNVSPLIESGLSFSVDPMSVWNELSEDCLTGSVAVNVFGGGTITSEVEFLAGINMKYFASSVGIVNYLNEKEYNPSIVTAFKNMNYSTVGIHPSDSSFYERNLIYKKYGFDKTIFMEDMKYTDRYDAYISDDSLAEQIIYECNNNDSSSPAFIWAVSIAGHAQGLENGVKYDPNFKYAIDVSYDGNNLDDEALFNLKRAVNCFYEGCLAYKKLVDYYSSVNEPTVILMFGDHCPGISLELFDLMGYNHVGNNIDELFDMYTTPVLMYKNYDTENAIEPELTGENVQYLSSALFDYAGLPDTKMTKIIKYIRSMYKTNSVKLLLDDAGNSIQSFTPEQSDCYINFGVLQNDLVFNNNDYRWLWE